MSEQGLYFVGAPKPQKPIKQVAPDATKFFEHSGESDFNSFCSVISDLFSGLKFLPKWDQMGYEHGDPLTSKDPAQVAEFLDAMGITSLDQLDSLPEDWEPSGNYSKQAHPLNPASYFGYNFGIAYQNLNFSPKASTWEYISGYNSLASANDLAIRAELEASGFNWSSDWDQESIGNVGGDKGYYQIAADGDINSTEFTSSDAFYLMCSMLESRTRVFNTWEELLGSIDNVNDHLDVIDHIDSWINMEVDPHNVGLLKMFFGMQSDFINTVDAYINHDTYWGDTFEPIGIDDPRYGLSGFATELGNKVDSYIAGLTDQAQKDAALELRNMWFKEGDHASLPGSSANGGVFWDEVDGRRTGEIIADSDVDQTNWVKYFWGKLTEESNEEVVRIVVTNMLNRTSNTEYNKQKELYEEKKSDKMMDDVMVEKAAMKRRSELRNTGKRSAVRNITRRSRVTKALRKGALKKGLSKVSAARTKKSLIANNVRKHANSAVNKSIAAVNNQVKISKPVVQNHISNVSIVPKGNSSQSKKKDPKMGQVI